MKRYCSTGQSPQRAVAPTEEEKEEEEELYSSCEKVRRYCKVKHHILENLSWEI
jgi:hypothetical protein